MREDYAPTIGWRDIGEYCMRPIVAARGGGWEEKKGHVRRRVVHALARVGHALCACWLEDDTSGGGWKQKDLGLRRSGTFKGGAA